MTARLLPSPMSYNRRPIRSRCIPSNVAVGRPRKGHPKHVEKNAGPVADQKRRLARTASGNAAPEAAHDHVLERVRRHLSKRAGKLNLSAKLKGVLKPLRCVRHSKRQRCPSEARMRDRPRGASRGGGGDRRSPYRHDLPNRRDNLFRAGRLCRKSRRTPIKSHRYESS